MKLKTICALALGLSNLVTYAQIVDQSQQNTLAVIENPVVKIVENKLDAPQACCAQFQNLVKTPIPMVLTEIKLDETSSIYDFGYGPQAYLFFELPTYKKPYHINVNNIPQAPGFFNKTAYSQIAMRIETFDSSFNSKRIYQHTAMKKRGLGFDKTVFINPANGSEKYLLVYGDIKAAPEETIVSEKAVTMTGASASLALSILVAVASGGRVFLANPIVADGVDSKVEIAANDKGILIIEAKGLVEK